MNAVPVTVAVQEALPSARLSVTVTVPSAALAVVPGAAPGSVADDGTEIDRKPAGSTVTGALGAVPVVAVTVTVMVEVVPSARPVIVHAVAPEVEHDFAPGAAEAV